MILDEVHRAIDLLLTVPGAGLWAIEIKRSLTPKLERGFHNACQDLQPDHRFVVYPGVERYPVTPEVDAIAVADLCRALHATAA